MPTAIVLNGFAFGGTNIAWNILQSHPGVCSSFYELGETLAHLWPPDRLQVPLLVRLLRRNLVPTAISGPLVRRRLHRQKMRNYQHPLNGLKYEDIPYTQAEVIASVLCLKTINKDIYLNGLLGRVYPEARFVGLMRDGYALCEGWMRRGWRAHKVGQVYREVGEIMLGAADYLIVKFEDMVARPFAVAEQMYAFCGLEPTTLDKLRLKSKRVLSAEGAYSPRFGSANHKYWFDRTTITDLLVRTQSALQAQRLSAADRRAFEREARPILEFFGY